MLNISKNALLYTGIGLTVVVALYSLRYLFVGADSVDALSETDAFLKYLSGQEGTFWRDFAASQKPLYHLNEFAVVGHISAASVALLAGIIQFIPLIRTEAPLLHRASGYLYAFTAILGLALGAYISFALPMIGGTKTIISNVIGGAIGITFVLIAFVCIRNKQYLKHGQWMLRSYAILSAIVTVYLLIGVFSLLGLEAELGYGLAHMVCFPINIFVAEIIIRKSPSGFFAAAHPG
ncbi:DUF2306 domain-containing protein [Sulfitobacter sp. M220]|uniref:DUF2306 domain-containing protein n=1 Tax=Sulfitobacter sp. M220 TaxID=2675333 RepID=UPI001F20E587|nr:DUF2306 domain-containing protein [Sulfitobacter sp. M220]MCF7779098.1 DUF2306 domain-containing protein [Sulfitobacter sp. M220]|tara:strand:+ start:9273 stop:9980 length:708 start_codon:yes stop_codon:yes gene_type:complete